MATATWAPLDPHAWLALAELSLEDGLPAATSTGLLNMSFLTGPNAIAVMPNRLALAARLPERIEADIRALALHDVRLLARQPDGVTQLRAVWRQAPASGRNLLAARLQEADAKLLQDVPQ